MRIRIAAALTVAASLLLGGCGDDRAADQAADRPVPDPLRIATEGAYPPFNMVDPAGNLIGFDVDVAKQICARLKVECMIVAQNWDGIIPGLQTGKYDAILAGMSITEEREKVVDFSQGYASTPAYFVAPDASPLQQVPTGLEKVNLTEIDAAEQADIDTLRAALSGKTVGVQTATIHANFLDTYLGNAITIRRYDTQDNLALDLASGRIDAGLADGTAWEPFLDSPQGQGLGFFGPSFDGGLFGRGQGVALRKGEDRLREAIDGAITEMKQDGTLRELAMQWFGFDGSMH